MEDTWEAVSRRGIQGSLVTMLHGTEGDLRAKDSEVSCTLQYQQVYNSQKQPIVLLEASIS